MGEIAVFRGATVRDMKKLYPIRTLFRTGKAGEAFDGIPYPEGVPSRGSIWPFGLYVCPGTHRFLAFFHNETGWNGGGTGYDSFGRCHIPKYDSDFRHVGLMHSDDEGRTWSFDRWVLTGEAVCFSEAFDPTNSVVKGQPMKALRLGAGDFSLFAPAGEYLYIFYTMLEVDAETGVLTACDTYAARARKRDDGVMGDFVKYYGGAFCEAGNCGKESPVARDLWHARVLYLREEGAYMMSGSTTSCRRVLNVDAAPTVERGVQLLFSEDLIHWSEPTVLRKDGRPFGDQYCAFYSDDEKDAHWESGNSFCS